MTISARRILTGTILLLSTILLNTASLAADPLATRYYEDAVSRFNAGDTKGAIIQLKNALQRDPAQLSAKILLGRAYLKTGEPRIAEEQLMEATKLGADPLLVALDLARARNELGKFDDNIENLVPIDFPRSQQPDLWVELGIARLGKDDPDGARIAFEEALQIKPAHTGGRIGLARIPLKDNRFSEAEKLANEILAAEPQNAEAWFIKGSAAHAQGKFKDAIEAYGKAYELDPQHLQAALGEATAMLEAGKPATAAALLKPLREKYPASATIPYLQSEAFRAIGRPEEAKAARSAASGIISSYSPADIRHNPSQLLLFGTIASETGQLETAYKYFSAYVESNSGDIVGRKMLGKTLLGLGKPGEAQKVLLRISTSNQADAESLALLGDAYFQLGDLASAERYYRDGLQNHRGGPALMRRLGMTQFNQGRQDRALGTLQALVDNTSGLANADTSLLLGLLYYSESRFNEAGAIADRLARDYPKNFTARNLQGLVAVALGDPEKGREILEQILAEKPGFRPARYNLIKMDVAKGRYAAAAAALQEMRVTNPNDERALLESARLAQAQGDQRLAISYLEKARELDPKEILPVTELINAYLATSQVSQAMARAIELDHAVPNHFLVKDALARVHIAGGDYQDAAIALKEVARLAGDDPERLLYTAKLQSSVGALDDAVWSLTKALAIDPQNIDTRIELATALFRQRKYETARVEVDEVLKQERRQLRALTLLADLQIAGGQVEDAVMTYRTARTIADTAPLIVSHHRALMTVGREQEAFDELQRWHASRPGVPLVMGLLADHLQFRGKRAESLALREELVELVPQDPGAWQNLASALSSFDSERALKAALKAHEIAPSDAGVLDTLGWTFIQLGELDKGLAHLREALSRDAGNPTIRYHLAVALQEFGNINGARREFDQALQLSDNFPERADAQARLNALQLLR